MRSHPFSGLPSTVATTRCEPDDRSDTMNWPVVADASLKNANRFPSGEKAIADITPS